MGKTKKKAATSEANGKVTNGSASHDKAVKFHSTAEKSNGGDYLKPSGKGMKPSPSLATLNRLDREMVVLWRRPFQTVWYFFNELCWTLYQYSASLLQHKLLVFLASVAIAAAVHGYRTPGPHQGFVRQSEEHVLWYGYWVFLGILSSVGLGSGLHTFILYLAPHIVKITMAAYDCETLDFPSPPYPHEVTCPDDNSTKHHITIWSIWAKVWLESLMWGVGTALGELPPYFIARNARISGDQPDDPEYLEFLADIQGVDNKDKEATFYDRCKQSVESIVIRVGFFGILLFASIPNPLFDLAGLTCGHCLVPFWVFFGATLIGKAVIKAQIQTIFIVFLFSEHHVEELMNLVAKIPRFGELINTPVREMIKAQKTKFHHGHVEESSNYLGMLMGYLVTAMVFMFLGSIINSWAQDYHKRLCKKRTAHANKRD
ncbi:hypothetical protein L596_023821 [Steinernema carpocapsae]|uniref:Vacuole membrane protein 1 n=1 Tax=Steinernema carpocapsae TaxID=34508 RepID=A0A4U5MFK5_STECR|nr:hypothetical protein L596_023821 [Steinernema carpocapsae]